MRRHREYPYPNSKIVLAIFWTAMAFGSFIIFLILAAVVLLIWLSLTYDDDSPSSGAGPVTEAERRFCHAFALGFGDEREAAAQYGRAIALSADDERLPRPKLGADAADSPYGEGWLITAALNNRGAAWISLGETDKALADFSEALRIDPGMRMAYENRALAHIRTGDYAGAIADFDSAVAYSRNMGFSSKAPAYLGRVVARALAGDESAADADFRLARMAGAHLADDPERAKESVLNSLGSIGRGGAIGNLCPDDY